jgi:hypothetical protein
MSAPDSNVRVVSNVYPVARVRKLAVPGWTGYAGVCDDPLFRRQIRGKDALKKLAQEKVGMSIYERDVRQNLLDARLVAEWQIEIYWDQEGSGRCVDCSPGERPFGIIRSGSKCKVINRCENPRCRCRP